MQSGLSDTEHMSDTIYKHKYQGSINILDIGQENCVSQCYRYRALEPCHNEEVYSFFMQQSKFSV